MRARWASFAIGFWLIVAPLVLGHREVAAVLHDVALGLLVCVGALAAMEWPHARFAVAAPGAWLIIAGRTLGWGSAVTAANELAAGAAIILLALVPQGRAGDAREPAKMAA